MVLTVPGLEENLSAAAALGRAETTRQSVESKFPHRALFAVGLEPDPAEHRAVGQAALGNQLIGKQPVAIAELVVQVRRSFATPPLRRPLWKILDAVIQ